MKDKIIINVIGKTQCGKTYIVKWIRAHLILGRSLSVTIPDKELDSEIGMLGLPSDWEEEMLNNIEIEINEINISRKKMPMSRRIKSAWLLLKTGDLTAIKHGEFLK